MSLILRRRRSTFSCGTHPYTGTCIETHLKSIIVPIFLRDYLAGQGISGPYSTPPPLADRLTDSQSHSQSDSRRRDDHSRRGPVQLSPGASESRRTDGLRRTVLQRQLWSPPSFSGRILDGWMEVAADLESCADE